MNSKWDSYFLDQCGHVAKLSKDESTKLGCVIVGAHHEIRASGYNSFPRRVNDYVPERQQRPLKYKWFEHAERNAIYNAALVGVSLLNCTLYCEWPPCTDCARAIIQCGISEVVVRSKEVPDRWKEDIAISFEMLAEAGVRLREAMPWP